jgi:lipoyl(octanoyl) transferase
MIGRSGRGYLKPPQPAEPTLHLAVGEAPLGILDLGRAPYGSAYEAQVREHAAVLAARDSGRPIPGTLILVEHDPAITVSNRAGAESNLLATPEVLARAGVEVARTDRGGDITYHGPGQLVAYPILDLNLLNLGLHDYMRLLESAVIDTCAGFGIRAEREEKATGVWVTPPGGGARSKLCAMGVRVRRWVSMHGLALNVTTNLEHFDLINPCGLGRPVTSLERLLGGRAPSFADVKKALSVQLTSHIEQARLRAETARAAHTG